jgi:calcineurin-like phosphoesterase family protein
VSRRFWFTADLHIEHGSIISYADRRQFVVPGTENDRYEVERDLGVSLMYRHIDIPLMNRTLFANWNAVVQPGDVTFLLGDFCLKNKGRILELMAEFGPLNGDVILVKGNHDRCTNGFYRSLGWRAAGGPIRVGELTLSHRPPMYTETKPGGIYLCGHVHTAWAEKTFKTVPGARIINVGVDVRGFRPVQLSELGLSDDLLGPKSNGCTCLRVDPCQACQVRNIAMAVGY